MIGKVKVIGAGLAGIEASLQLARRNIGVELYEMKRISKSPVHKLDTFAELVCSNSFRSDSIENAAGLMKAELRLLGSEVIQAADKFKVPAGSALAVDRELFSRYLTQLVESNPLIEVIDKEVTTVPDDGVVVVATGPMTSDLFASDLQRFTGSKFLYFFDAVAPIIEADSIDMKIAYFKNRYDKGDGLYINCPMSKPEYDVFYQELIDAKCVDQKEYELRVFEGCLPIEEMARRGYKTLTFGPMKPVGLAMPDRPRPYAVVQLRQDNLAGSLYNIVGFQTHLTFPEQRRLLRMIPGLHNANIVRYGVMHKNTFLNGPALLTPEYQLRENPRIFIAGQLAGVEGYVESVGSGFIAAINAARYVTGKSVVAFPLETMLGSQAHYVANAEAKTFQPMNANFGLFPPLAVNQLKRDRKRVFASRSLECLKRLIETDHFG